MNTIQSELQADGICVLTFDRPDSSANIFDRNTLLELDAHLRDLGGKTRGIILTSAKPKIFIAGADLHGLQRMNAEELAEFITLGQSVFDRLAALPIPTVAAIHGACVGGGYELALACDWRIASPDRATKIGLPETQLGILPAWGGSTRLPRLIGVPAALDIILAGKTVPARHAKKLGMIDDIAPREYLVRVAGEMLSRGKHPHSVAHSGPVNAVVDVVIAKKARADVRKRTRRNYPAVEKALEVILHGSAAWNEADSLKRERDAVAELVKLDSTRNLIRLFFLQERAKKTGARTSHPERSAAMGGGGGRRAVEGPGSIAAIPTTTSTAAGATEQFSEPATDVRVKTPGPSTSALRASARDDRVARRSIRESCAVIGAGVMGAGIAQWLSTRGHRVILRDIDTARVAAGMATISKLYAAGVKRHVFTETEARAGLDRISPAPREVPLNRAGFVIEAAVEKMDVKKSIFRDLDERVPADAILATNTSALSITELAAATRHPGRVIGIHFFNPVHKMQLVEIVTGAATSPEVTQRTLKFVQSIGKLPVLVRDSPGFLVNRILLPYLIEAGNLFAAGADPAALDEAMLDFGMPMGPLRLIDEVGVDVAVDVAATLAAAFPDRIRVPEILPRMIAAGLLGKKSGAGFYRHESRDDSKPNPDALALRPNGSTPADAVTRMTFLMINEAARCLEESVVESPADVDFGMVMGTGWAPFRGGPMRYADTLGAGTIVETLNHLANTGGPHLAPCARLSAMAKTGATFYED